MNAHNLEELKNDDTGFLESCDKCNAFIYNWYWMGRSFVTYDNLIVCNVCRTQVVIETIANRELHKLGVIR